MNRLTSLVRKNPLASALVVIAIIAGVLFLRPTPQGSPPAPVSQPTPPPAAPGPAVQPSPQVAPGPASPAPVAAVPPPPPQAAGRADPFVPIVKARTGPAGGPRPVSLPPPAPLPPPLFPGPPGVAPASPPPPPRISTGAQLIGVLGDTGRVAILRIGGQVYIVAQGEMIQNRIRVELEDAQEGLVVLIEDGQRFEVRFG